MESHQNDQLKLVSCLIRVSLVVFNPLMPGGYKKVIHIQTCLQPSAAGLFKYV